MRVAGAFLIALVSLIGYVAALPTPAAAQVPAFVVTTPVNGSFSGSILVQVVGAAVAVTLVRKVRCPP